MKFRALGVLVLLFGSINIKTMNSETFTNTDCKTLTIAVAKVAAYNVDLPIKNIISKALDALKKDHIQEAMLPEVLCDLDFLRQESLCTTISKMRQLNAKRLCAAWALTTLMAANGIFADPAIIVIPSILVTTLAGYKTIRRGFDAFQHHKRENYKAEVVAQFGEIIQSKNIQGADWGKNFQIPLIRIFEPFSPLNEMYEKPLDISQVHLNTKK